MGAGLAAVPCQAASRCSQVGIGWPGWGTIHTRYMKNEIDSPPAPRAASQ